MACSIPPHSHAYSLHHHHHGESPQQFPNLQYLLHGEAHHVAVAHFKYVGTEHDVECSTFQYYDIDLKYYRTLINVYILHGFPNGKEGYADVHCPWGVNIVGPLHPRGGVLFQYELPMSSEAVPLTSSDLPVVIRNASDITRLDITFPIAYDIYSVDEDIEGINRIHQCEHCLRSFLYRAFQIHKKCCERVFFTKRSYFHHFTEAKKAIERVQQQQQQSTFQWSHISSTSEQRREDQINLLRSQSETFWEIYWTDTLPTFKKEFSRNWMKAKTLRGILPYLQAGYVDRYGDSMPSLSLTRHEVQHSYQHGRGEYLTLSDMKSTHSRPSSAVKVRTDNSKGSNDSKSKKAKDPFVINTNPLARSLAESTNPIHKAWHETLRGVMGAPLYGGRLNAVIERVKQSWTLTIFISSPFDGCELERKLFMENNVPMLTAQCRAKGIVLIVIDMRWGITKEMGDSGKTIVACMEGIDRSDIFLGYFGARYGSSTLLPNSSWIRNALDHCAYHREDLEYLRKYYTERSVTEMEWQHAFLHIDPDYVQPSAEGEVADGQQDAGASARCHVTSVTKPMSFFFYRAAAFDDKMYRLASQEGDVAIAALKGRHDVDEKDLEELIKQRETNMHKYCIESDSSDQAAERLKQEVLTKQQYLKEQSGNKHDAEACTVAMNYPEPSECAELMAFFCSRIMFDVFRSLDHDVGEQSVDSDQNALGGGGKKKSQWDKGSEERLPHLMFARSRLSLFHDFGQHVHAIEHFIYHEQPSPLYWLDSLLVTGVSGSGKSTIVAAFVQKLVKASKSSQALVKPSEFELHRHHVDVIYHFVGCNANSTFLMEMLRRVYEEFTWFLCKYVPSKVVVASNSLPEAEDVVILQPFDYFVNANDVFPEIIRLYDLFHESVPPLVIVLDAINQLVDEAYNDVNDITSSFEWLPLTLLMPKTRNNSRRIKLVLSCLEPLSVPVISSIEAHDGSVAGQSEAVTSVNYSSPLYYENLFKLQTDHGHNVFKLRQVGGLDCEQRQELISASLKAYSKAIDRHIMSRLWSYEACSNPMFLTFAIRELILHSSFANLERDIELIRQVTSVPALLQLSMTHIQDVLVVKGQVRPQLLRKVLLYIYCSREGLSLLELVQLISQDYRIEEDKESQRRTQRRQQAGTSITAEEEVISISDLLAYDTGFWTTFLCYSLQHLISLRRGVFNFAHDYVRQAVEMLYFGHGQWTIAQLEALAHHQQQLPIPSKAGGDAASVSAQQLLDNIKQEKIEMHKRLAIFFKGQSELEAFIVTNVQEYPRSMRELTFQQRLSGVRPSVVVAARVRPMNEREQQLCSSTTPGGPLVSTSIVKMKGKQVMVLDTKSKRDYLFALDFAFDSSGQPSMTHTSSTQQANALSSRSTPSTVVQAMNDKLQSNEASTNYAKDTKQSQTSTLPIATQEHIFQLCGVDVIAQTLDGYNVSVFAFGQTGSGKSYTMFGTEQDPGLIPRVIKELFKQLDVRQKQNVWKWSAHCSMIEIYNHEVKDLLGENGKMNRVRVRCELPAKPSNESENSGNGDGGNNAAQPPQQAETHQESRDQTITETEVKMDVVVEDEQHPPKKSKPRKGLQLATKDFHRQVLQKKKKARNKRQQEGEAEDNTASTDSQRFQTGKIILEGANMIPVTTFAAFEEVIRSGTMHRTTKSTKMNDVSSRSHCILTLTVHQTHVLTKFTKESKINLVDLAGNERGQKSGHLTKELRDEAIAINLSLTALNNCIRALTRSTSNSAGKSSKQSANKCYVPYRDSMLTWILQDSLGGNAKTILLSTISPSPDNTHETLCTLRYAAIAKEMPNGLKATCDDQALRQEADTMRKMEIVAKKHGMACYHLPEAHLELMHEFYTKRGEVAFKVGELLSSTWHIQSKIWDDRVGQWIQSEVNRKRIDGWIREWQVMSTSSGVGDWQEPRYLKVLPNDTINCRICYSCENVENSWIQQLQLTIDTQRPVVNISQVCGSIERNQDMLISLTAPSQEGLYMIWWKSDLQYSLADAERNYPNNYDNCDTWYNGFIAWLRVDPHIQTSSDTASAVAKFLPDDYQPVDNGYQQYDDDDDYY